MSKLERLRKIGLLEGYHVARHYMGLDSCVVGSAQYTSTDGAELTQETLYPALRALIESHAALGVRLDGSEKRGKGYFVRLTNIDLSRTVEFSEDVDLQGALEAQLMRGFETSADVPLWRLHVLGDKTVLFAFHHAIADGMSSMAFHVQLLRALQTVASNPEVLESAMVRVPQTTKMIPAVEHATNVRPSLPLVAHELHQLLVPVSLTAARKAWTGRPTPSNANLSATRVRIQPISAPLVHKLLVACRANQATFTGAVFVLLTCVVSRMLEADTKRKYQKIGGLVALSMRGVTGVSDYELCDYPSAFNTSAPVTTNFSWDAAAKMAQKLQAQKTQGREKIGMLHFLLGRFDLYCKDLMGTKREAGFTLSNLGRWTAPEVEGRWKMGRTMFAQCDVASGAFNCFVAGDPTGAANATFVWSEAAVDTEWMDKLVPLVDFEVPAPLVCLRAERAYIDYHVRVLDGAHKQEQTVRALRGSRERTASKSFIPSSLLPRLVCTVWS
ncbi:alcohol acetyltransferase [Mycena amicta]|nr:alcohol acetyltransferase [Mycena amicta]